MQGVTSGSQQTQPNAASSITVLPPPHPPIRAPPPPGNEIAKVLLLAELAQHANNILCNIACTTYTLSL